MRSTTRRIGFLMAVTAAAIGLAATPAHADSVVATRTVNVCELATSVHLSTSTVKTHIARTLTKLDARDRIHLAVLAHRHGLA